MAEIRFWDQWGFFLVCLCLVVFFVLLAAVGHVHHLRMVKFSPKFVTQRDGRVQMEFTGFGELHPEHTQRFFQQYKVGMKLTHKGVHYRIQDIREETVSSLLRKETKMVCYLEVLT